MKKKNDLASNDPGERIDNKFSLESSLIHEQPVDRKPEKKAKRRRTPREKARYHINRVFVSGTSRKLASERGEIASFGSRRTYEDTLATMYKMIDCGGIPKPKEIDFEFASKYLELRSNGVSQKTLDVDRLALSKVFHLDLPYLMSVLRTNLTSRTYSEQQVGLILEGLQPHIATSIRLCFVSGLRAHETLMILPLNERAVSPTRDWWDEQFDGMPDGELYSVVGKGGLIRPVKVPSDLVQELESLRMSEPTSVKDRGIFYGSHYGLCGGQNLSQLFSARSKKLLGWSEGLHGLRHSFAQSRMRLLMALGYPFSICLGIVSRELGHYRPNITLTYLR